MNDFVLSCWVRSSFGFEDVHLTPIDKIDD